MKRIFAHLVFLMALALGGCLSVGVREDYGFLQVQSPPLRVPDDIGQFVLVEGGEFTLGITDEYRGGFVKDEAGNPWTDGAKPALRINVPSFFMGKYEVTASEFCDFLNDESIGRDVVQSCIQIDPGGRTTVMFDGQYKPKPGYEFAPAIGVTYLGARRYCDWLSEKTGESIRLPSEVEWEYAARGTEGRTYPWGEETPLGRAFLQVHHLDVAPWDGPGVWIVGNFPGGASPEGIHDLIGNSIEWCGNYWFKYEEYLGKANSLVEREFYLPPISDETTGDGGITRKNYTVSRGGQYLQYESLSVTTGWSRARIGSPTTEKTRHFVGFRVLKEVP